MNKVKGLIFAVSVILLAFVIGIFIKEQQSFAEKDQEIRKVAIEKKEKKATEKKETEESSTEEVTEETKPQHVDPYKDFSYNAGEVSQIIRKEMEYSGEKVVFLTFDDGPDNSSSTRIMDILNENQVPATFFLQGQYINDNTQAVVKRMYDEGHGIAGHSFGHNYSYLYPGRVGNVDNIMADYRQALQRIRQYLGDDFSFKTWRYPGGHMSWQGLDQADAALKAEGVDWIDWNNMTGDAEPKSRRPGTVEGMVSKVKGLTEGSTSNMQVVLMHDNQSKELTIQALPQVIAYFKDQGYKFGKFN